MVSSLRLQNFRSYTDDSFEFGEGVNIIVGPNASGKTNLLEAVLVSCLGGSYRARDGELIQFDALWARLDAHSGPRTRTVKLMRMSTESGATKTLEDNGHTYKRITMQRQLPAVLFEPQHLLLLSGGPELRRSFVDDLLEQAVPGFGTIRRQYKRTLAQRNALLKSHHGYGRPTHLDARRGADEKKGSPENLFSGVKKRTEPYTKYGEGASQAATTPSAKSISRVPGSAGKQAGAVRRSDQLFAWNIRLSELGGQIVEHRQRLLTRFNEHLSGIYGDIAHQKAHVELVYEGTCLVDGYGSRMLHKLESATELDYQRGFTAYGPHRDDIAPYLDGHRTQDSASRGELRSLLLGLKILELQLLEQARGQAPLLLLDDVFSELDGARRRALTRFLQPYQTFITTTDADVVVQHFMNDCHIIPTTKSS